MWRPRAASPGGTIRSGVDGRGAGAGRVAGAGVKDSMSDMAARFVILGYEAGILGFAAVFTLLGHFGHVIHFGIPTPALEKYPLPAAANPCRRAQGR